MLIAEEYLLLALDEHTGKLRVRSDVLRPALGGALVAELALRERIGVTPHEAGWNKRGRITITNTTPTDDPELDAALAKLVENEGRKVKDLLSEYSTKKRRLSHGVRERLLDRLAATGALVIALLQVTGLLPQVVTAEDKRALKAKAKELTSGDWAAQAVKDAIQEAAVATTAAIGASTAATAGSRRRPDPANPDWGLDLHWAGRGVGFGDLHPCPGGSVFRRLSRPSGDPGPSHGSSWAA